MSWRRLVNVLRITPLRRVATGKMPFKMRSSLKVLRGTLFAKVFLAKVFLVKVLLAKINRRVQVPHNLLETLLRLRIRYS